MECNLKRSSVNSLEDNFLDDGKEGDDIIEDLPENTYKKKSIILLTPPMMPMKTPKLEDDHELLWSWFIFQPNYEFIIIWGLGYEKGDAVSSDRG